MQIIKQIQTLNDKGYVIDNKLSWNPNGAIIVKKLGTPMGVVKSTACALFKVVRKGPVKYYLIDLNPSVLNLQ